MSKKAQKQAFVAALAGNLLRVGLFAVGLAGFVLTANAVQAKEATPVDRASISAPVPVALPLAQLSMVLAELVDQRAYEITKQPAVRTDLSGAWTPGSERYASVTDANLVNSPFTRFVTKRIQQTRF